MPTMSEALEDPSLIVEVDDTEDGDISGFDPMDYGDTQPEPEPVGDIAQEHWSEEDANNLAAPEPQAPAPQPRGQARSPENALQARLRIAERNAREGQIYKERLDYIMSRLAEQDQEQEEEEAIEVVPYEEDPVLHQAQKLELVNQRLEQAERQRALDNQRQQIGQLMSKADEYTNAAIAEVGPDIWNQAMQHLAAVRIDDYVERNPHLTRDEASKVIGSAIVKEKIKMVADGRNPAEVYLRDAIRFGFRVKPQAQAPQATRQPNPTGARQEIQKANARDRVSGKSIASVQGAPAKARLSASSTLGMDDRLFREMADDAIKEKGGKLSIRDFVRPN